MANLRTTRKREHKPEMNFGLGVVTCTNLRNAQTTKMVLRGDAEREEPKPDCHKGQSPQPSCNHECGYHRRNVINTRLGCVQVHLRNYLR